MSTESPRRLLTQPFELFVGRWTGVANVFSPRGELLQTFPGEIRIHHESERVLSYTQLIDTTRTTALLTIDGKAVSGQNEDFLVEGAETTPGIYLFTLRSRRSKIVYSNNHYFLGDNLRNVIGPTLSDGQVAAINVQTYTRISYE